MRSRHQLIRAATGIHNVASIPIETVQAVIPSWICAYYPNDRIVDSISRRNKGRATSVQVHTPGINDGRRTGWRNLESREFAAVSTKSNIGALIRSVGGRCLDYEARGFLCGC